MVDKIQKAIDKLNEKERTWVAKILRDINNKKLAEYDLKKLKGYEGIYRIRKGSIRIVYKIKTDDSISILSIERRSSTTYQTLG